MKSKRFATYAKKNLVEMKMIKNEFKLYHKVRDHCNYTEKFRGTAHSICNLRYKTPKQIPIVFHNGYIYDWQFIINELEKIFVVSLNVQEKIQRNILLYQYQLVKNLIMAKKITYRLKFIDSFRFMLTSLSSPVDNLSEELHSDNFILNLIMYQSKTIN